tara:strand:- start:54 stop:380 length:327 start_codon:yes stop_codon:yes gene_type:complete
MLDPVTLKLAGAKIVGGFTCATVATLGIQVAEAQSFIPSELLEGGAWGTLVASLMYAVVTLWRSNQAIQREIRDNREKEIRESQEREATVNRTNQELLTAIRNMDKDK